MRRPLLALALCLLTVGAACAPGGPTTSATTLHVLAGSELKDIEPLLPDLEKATGYRLQLTYVGSLDGAERIHNGERSELAWFSTGRYLTLLEGSGGRITAQEKIMLSPVVLGVKHSVAQRFGWAGGAAVTWADVAARAKSGELRFGMTNPAASNSGFMALVGVAEAFARSGGGLDAGSIDAKALREFFTGQALTAGSSGFLADSYVRGQDALGGMINYESILLSLNQGSQLHEKLDLVYPREGIATADYPLLLLDPSRRQAFDRIAAWFRQPSVQERIMRTTNRRPALPEAKPDARFPIQLLIELPFPSSLEVVNRLLDTYLDQARPPAHTIFVLDTSGSMEGRRLDALRSALIALTGSDTSLSGRFARFRQREEVTFTLFSSRVYDQRDFIVHDAGPSSDDMNAIRNYVNGVRANGGTAIYDAVFSAYQVVAARHGSEPDRYFSIVLMTDGENNAGRNASRFLTDFRRLPSDVQEVKTFAILFGEGSPGELQQVASTTGGKVFDGRSTPLEQVFKEIRGYQ